MMNPRKSLWMKLNVMNVRKNLRGCYSLFSHEGIIVFIELYLERISHCTVSPDHSEVTGILHEWVLHALKKELFCGKRKRHTSVLPCAFVYL
jgi:hypothetical protein